MPMCNFGSMASNCPKDSRSSARRWNPRFASSISLITGALPAQYGFQTAGVVDIQTKTGLTNPGFALSMYGGQLDLAAAELRIWRTLRPGRLVLHRRFSAQRPGIENPTSSFNAIHDTTNQFHGFAYVSGIIDPDTRVSLILGGFNGRFKSPIIRASRRSASLLKAYRSFNSAPERDPARSTRNSACCRCRNISTTIDVQISAFMRSSILSFSPDWLGDLLFNGIAQQASRTVWAKACRPMAAGGSTSSIPCGLDFLPRATASHSSTQLTRASGRRD